MAESSGQQITPELYRTIIAIVDERVGELRVTREEYDQLRAAVTELVKAQAKTEARLSELAEAQKRTEARLDSLAERVEELAEAQKRTEARLDSLALRVEELAEAQKRTEARVEELAEAQKRTEARVEELAEAQKRTEARVEELAEAQKRTEARVEELAEAQKKTEARVEELAEAQKKTEEILQGVIREQKNMKKEIGGLSATIGYTLENRAISKLPKILEKDFGIHIDLMDRRFIEYPDGQEEEINIYGEGRSNGDLIYIIGESKSQLGKKDVDKFFKRLGRLSTFFRGKIIPVLVTHLVRPKVERYALEKIEGLLIYKSFQLED